MPACSRDCWADMRSRLWRDWYRKGGEVSDRQWRDLLGVLKVQGSRLDQSYLAHWAGELGVTDLLRRALTEGGL